jgi:phosphinothricin acetyltransferase
MQTEPTPLTIRAACARDGAAIAHIDAEGLATGHASFREHVHTWQTWDDSYEDGLKLVAEVSGEVAGWAALSRVSTRHVYSGVGEVSIYVSSRFGNKGVGRALVKGLVDVSERHGYWTLVAQVFPENTGSLSLHEGTGFRRIGLREGLGRMSYGAMAGQWRDVVLLERRSALTGQS